MAMMAQGRVGLGKLQLGRETTPGTSVAATTVWRGAASFIEDQRLVKIVEEMVGILGGTNRSYIPELLAGVKLSETEATFEQFPYLLVNIQNSSARRSAPTPNRLSMAADSVSAD